MGDEEAAFIAATQDTLGKLISKPKMTDKYLKKPPFRFLHDIVMEVTRTTTFGQGLFSTEESDASKLSEKAAKVEFLNKAISLVAFATGEKLDVQANKIVAGLEPDKTNAWLQKLSHAASTCAGPKSDEAVQRVLSGETAAPAKKEKKAKDKKEEAPPAEAPPAGEGGDAAAAEAEEKKKKDEARRKKRDEEKKRKAAEEAAAAGGEAPPPAEDPAAGGAADEEAAKKAKKEEERKKREEDKKKREERKKKEADKEAAAAEEARKQAEAAAAAQAAEQEQAGEADAAAAQAQAQAQAEAEAQAQAQAQADAAAQAAAAQAAAAQAAAEEQQQQQLRASPPPDHMPDGGMTSAPGSAMGVRPSQGGQGPSAEEIAANANMMGEQDLRRPERPRTAGRRPPKVQSKVQTSAENPVQAAAAPVIIGEGAKDDDDEDCFEAPAGQSSIGMGSVKAGTGGVHGKLVSNLLAEQKKEEEERLKREEENTREEFDEGGGKKGIRMGKLKVKDKNKDAQITEIDTAKLGEIIQSLCQAANPLGKSIDLVNEDIANMGKELDKWKKEYRQASDDYQSQLTQTEEILQPLYQKVAELDDKIAEQRAKIRNSRSRICQNDEKISLLLESVVSNTQRH